VNILQANVEHVQEHIIGIMLVATAGDEKQVHAGIEFLQSIGLNVEVVGHVPNAIITFN
jgi:D-methionine transport system ATP-binding protein